MKLVSVSLARSIWMVPFEEVNPLGLDLVPICNGIRSRYGFQKVPKIEEISQGAPNGLQFANGSMKTSEGSQIEITSFTIYRDGLVVDTRAKTSASDEFLTDALTFVAMNHRLHFSPEMIRELNYLSEVVVTAEVHLSEACDKVARFAEVLSATLGQHYAANSIRFGTPPGRQDGPNFTFEYRVGTPLELRRYFSQAPCPTDQHLGLLDQLERTMGP